MDKTLGFIGILKRGGKVKMGQTAINLISHGYFAFIAKDASENTKKLIQKGLKNSTLGSNINSSYTKEELGSAVGYAEASFLLILDPKAAKKLKEENDEKTTI